VATGVDASERQRILADNRRLHSSTAGVYDQLHPHMRNSFEQWLQSVDIRRMVTAVRAQSGSGAEVLDLGCGTGNLTVRFLEEGCRVTAVDMSREMLDVLAGKLARVPDWRERCQITQHDLDTFAGRPGEFDIVSLSSVVHHLPDYLAVLVRLAASLRHGGFLYLVHEPAHRGEMTASRLALRRLWSAIPRGTNRLLRHRTTNATLHHQWQDEDTTYADYHYHRDGISVSAISSALAPGGLWLVDTSRYNAHESSFASWLDNYWFNRFRYEQFQRTYFRALWQRQ
jgi:2-polyprenyl-3-methyl-5-hydroxy-6-metoxy-1,4-benzoquinol methylase